MFPSLFAGRAAVIEDEELAAEPRPSWQMAAEVAIPDASAGIARLVMRKAGRRRSVTREQRPASRTHYGARLATATAALAFL